MDSFWIFFFEGGGISDRFLFMISPILEFLTAPFFGLPYFGISEGLPYLWISDGLYFWICFWHLFWDSNELSNFGISDRLPYFVLLMDTLTFWCPVYMQICLKTCACFNLHVFLSCMVLSAYQCLFINLFTTILQYTTVSPYCDFNVIKTKLYKIMYYINHRYWCLIIMLNNIRAEKQSTITK